MSESSMDMDKARRTFVAEARELLEAMEAALLEAEQNGLGEDGIGAIFRAAHTIKGSSGLFGLDLMVSFTHLLESVFDRLREGRLSCDPEMTALFLEACDHLGCMVDSFEESGVDAEPDPERRERLRQRLQAILDGGETANAVAVVPTDVEVAVRDLDPDGPPVASDNWHISLRLARDTLRNGLDPLSFFRYMEKFGKIVRAEVVPDGLPPFEEADPELLYLGFEIQFSSDADRRRIEEVFEFLSEDSRIRIYPPNSRIGQFVSLIHEDSDLVGRMGEILVACGALTPSELENALAIQRASGGERLIGEIVVEENGVHPVVVEAALRKQESVAREKPGGHSQHAIKVDVHKLDHLIDLVGELVIAGAGAKIAAKREGSVPCEEAVNSVTSLVEEIRDSALGLRMIPVGEVFNRFPRVVRDIAKDLGKKIDLEITGAETELDKSMVEKLTDPLMHIVRNAIDHGVESVEERVAAGKHETGTVHLDAYHESGLIVIEVRDDGKGMDRERILAKAVAKGLAQPGQNMTDAEIFRFVFEPGFSTAETVTNLSGRGVGMDVVKRNIEQLRGDVEIESARGEGTTLRIRLPLTLAIIDGFRIVAGKSSYVVPLELVEECAELVVSDLHGDIVGLRGESLPFIRLRDLFAIPGERPARECLVVVQHGGGRLGLVVDQLAGELQAVIKPLGSLFRDLKAIGGTTILGDGAVALILDVFQLGQIAAKKVSAAPRPATSIQSGPHSIDIDPTERSIP